jgi:putative ABC transport system permease protein
MTLNFQRVIPAAPVEVQPLPLILAATAGMASGILAGWLPARRAAQGSIASLKSGRRGRAPLSEPRWRRHARVIVPALAVVFLAAQAALGSATFGGIAMGLLVAGAILLVRPWLRLVSVPVGSIAGESGRIGIRDQSRAPGRPIGAATVLTLGLGLVVWIANTTKSFEIYVSNRMMSHHRSDLVVHSRANQMATMSGTLRLPARVLDEIRAIPGVKAVGADAGATSLAPEVGVIAMDEARLLLPELRGIHLEPGSERDAFELVARGEAILADRLLREQQGVRIGDVLRISTPSGPLERPVVGMIEDQFQSPKGNVAMSLSLYQAHWRDPTFARAYVLAAEGASVEELRQTIGQSLGDRYGLRAENIRSHASWVADNVRKASSFLYAMAAITLFVVLIGTADALAASVIERTREIGVLRAIGYTPGSMGQMVLAQSFAIGLAGAGLAVALGVGMAIAFVEGVLPQLLGWQLDVHATYGLIAVAAGSGVIACIVGGALPAARAAHLPVVVALRRE